MDMYIPENRSSESIEELMDNVCKIIQPTSCFFSLGLGGFIS